MIWKRWMGMYKLTHLFSNFAKKKTALICGKPTPVKIFNDIFLVKQSFLRTIV